MTNQQRLDNLSGYADKGGFHVRGASPIKAEELLAKMGFEAPIDFLIWIINIFANQIIDFGCSGHCCHSLLPVFVKACEDDSKKSLDVLFEEQLNIQQFSSQQRSNFKTNYLHFFKKARSKQLKELFNYHDSKMTTIISDDKISVYDTSIRPPKLIKETKIPTNKNGK
ncbi:hypothetical protein HYV44_02620 [Candidatus Microgenomates bacterium]|nr:hypothetical protein [Candidatus Microgenomates bacterium]